MKPGTMTWKQYFQQPCEEGERSDRLREYHRSRDWRNTRDAAIARANFRCEYCAAIGKLFVHRLHYLSLGTENPEDLRVVCETCYWNNQRKNVNGQAPPTPSLNAATRELMRQRYEHPEERAPRRVTRRRPAPRNTD